MRFRLLAAGILLLSSLCANAQTYRPDAPGAESPLVLLEVPKDAEAYYEAKQRALELIGQRKYAEAEPLAERLAREYPRDPENWRLLAGLKEESKKYAEAAAAYEKAGSLWGWDIGYAYGYLAAANHLRAGNKSAALDRLRWLVLERHGYWRERLYTWPEFEALRGDPEFLRIIGRVDTAGWSRTQGWRHDIDHLFNEVKRVNPDYRDKPFPTEFIRRYESLKRDVAGLSDEQIFIGMQRMLAVLRQGHLVLWADQTARVPNRYLPLRFYAFPEGVFIIDADEAHRDLVGSRVITIGTLPAEEALRRLAGATSVDGDMQYLWGASRIAETYYLKGIGAIGSSASADLNVQEPGGRRRRIAVATLAKEREGRQDRLLAPHGVTAPLFVRDMAQSHWEQPLPDEDAHYVQVNNLRDDKDEPIAAFGQRLWKILDASKPKNVILDLRHNNGGTTQTYPELLRTLIAFSRIEGNRLYVLIGRRTFSAAGNFVTDLERLADPVFVGEATSECCNLYGDPTYVQLPYSQVQGELTAVKWQLSEPGDRRREMSPEVPVQLTAKAYFAGQDPALETIYRMIRRSKATPSK